jgi:6,7-dimethyl-8-ribityllumazine synthase
MQVSVIVKKPIGFGLIAAENLTQAKERTDPSKLNKGKEVAQSLVEMLI